MATFVFPDRKDPGRQSDHNDKTDDFATGIISGRFNVAVTLRVTSGADLILRKNLAVDGPSTDNPVLPESTSSGQQRGVIRFANVRRSSHGV